MEKLQLKKLIKVCSLLFLFSSCYINKNISVKNKIYLDKIENQTGQSILSFILKEKIKEILINYPNFTITDTKKNADFILSIKILKFERIPIFFDKTDADNIVGAKFKIDIELELKEKENVILNKILTENISSSIYKEYREEKIFEKLSEQIAQKIYFELIGNKR